MMLGRYEKAVKMLKGDVLKYSNNSIVQIKTYFFRCFLSPFTAQLTAASVMSSLFDKSAIGTLSSIADALEWLVLPSAGFPCSE